MNGSESNGAAPTVAVYHDWCVVYSPEPASCGTFTDRLLSMIVTTDEREPMAAIEQARASLPPQCCQMQIVYAVIWLRARVELIRRVNPASHDIMVRGVPLTDGGVDGQAVGEAMLDRMIAQEIGSEAEPVDEDPALARDRQPRPVRLPPFPLPNTHRIDEGASAAGEGGAS